MADEYARPVITELTRALAGVGRDAVRGGLVIGSGGNLSARLPGQDEFVVTGAGTWLDRLEDQDFARLRASAGASDDSRTAAGPAPTTELGLHLAAYRSRPDVNAVIHLHPQATLLLDALGESVRLITTDHAFYVRRVGRVPPVRPGTPAVGQAFAAAIGDGTDCVILSHHGIGVVGPDIPTAWRRVANLEEAARLTYRALLLTGGLPGRPIVECPISFAEGDTV